MSSGEGDFLRLDKWLVFARFCKTRSVAGALVESGRLRIAGSVVSKPHYKLRVGEVLTFPQGDYVRVIKVLSLPSRRGPANEAQACYEDLHPTADQVPLPRGRKAKAGEREPGSGRPTKRDRREIERFKGG
ncbi:RNA-binding S4 domain-containing protein [Aquibaculum arenosum]|uniref:RNA-binding S4 domain-containing protein n=1 Tax=Aquibaculum arenosum TaxID=3032591 RepID=A0ABT5YQ84_9PROT|nr:RNA-binding S4 domain-containing protein [Fodinicurvata sp. CAU 1616]MDF2097142.1 RNA-binding S4 domain-containing protein [Fodinicurvata sp. CAU 1616]